jgi:hypothetical protein
MKEGIYVQIHICKFHTIIDQLLNIGHVDYNEDLTFPFLWSVPPFFHSLLIWHNTCINELFMELVCGHLLQNELQFKQKKIQPCYKIRNTTS